jgi:DNA-binding NarL/FixJ family response regulator
MRPRSIPEHQECPVQITPQQPLTVVLVDDSDLSTAGLAAILEPLSARVTLVDTRTALARPGDLDVILYEPLGLTPTYEAMLRDLRRGSEAHVVAFSWADQSQQPAPVAGPLLDKRLAAHQLVRTLEDMVTGRWTAPITTPIAPPAPVVLEERRAAPEPAQSSADPFMLTPREGDVIALVVAGRSNSEIGEELSVSINSVKTYIRSAYRKIGVTRRSQAVLWGMTHGYQPDADLGHEVEASGTDD